MKTEMKKIFALLLAVVCLCAAHPVWAEETEGTASGVAWILQNYFGTELSASARAQARQDTPAVACAMGVQVTFTELVADGDWVLTSAQIKSTSPNVLAMPGSANRNDRVCGMNGENISDDQRSYLTVAQEEDRQLVAVYVYPKEFDSEDCGSYFLDHLLTSADSFLMIGGANYPLTEEKAALTWNIEIYAVDSADGSYTLLEHTEIPAAFSILSEKLNLE